MAAAQEPATATRDLVGWALQSPLRASGRLTDAVARQVVATALGVEEAALAGVDGTALHTALDRLRSLVAYCDKLVSEATFDDLTGALRRGAGMAALGRELDRARRSGGTLVVAFLDVDGLKAVNDREGHAAGDDLLRAVVVSVRDRIRSYDLVFRYGGDEFVAVLVAATVAQAEHTIADIGSSVTRRTRDGSFSAGIVQAVDGDTPETVVARADAELYALRAAAVG
ncbi:MAG: GGDEF domain-containing protein [Candidatus Dormibacteria bacterium]